MGPAAATVNLAASDLDLDRDIDLLIVADRSAPVAVLNDRLLRFHRTELPADLIHQGPWNGVLVLDANHDGRSDLLFVGPGQRPVLLLSRPTAGATTARRSSW